MSITNYLGKYLLAGLTYVDDNENVINREELHGFIVRINPEEGLVVRMQNGEEFQLPHNLAALQPAEPGEYYLQSTEEIVLDPDFVAVWMIRVPDSAIPKS